MFILLIFLYCSINYIMTKQKINYENGDVYHGECVDNMKHGMGTLTHVKEFDCYCGQWKNDKRHGYGMSSTNFEEVAGIWEDDVLITKLDDMTPTSTNLEDYKEMFDAFPELKYAMISVYLVYNGIRIGFVDDNGSHYQHIYTCKFAKLLDPTGTVIGKHSGDDNAHYWNKSLNNNLVSLNLSDDSDLSLLEIIKDGRDGLGKFLGYYNDDYKFPEGGEMIYCIRLYDTETRFCILYECFTIDKLSETINFYRKKRDDINHLLGSIGYHFECVIEKNRFLCQEKIETIKI